MNKDDPFQKMDIESGSSQRQNQQSSIIADTFKASSHPVAAFFHVAFKLAAIGLYLSCAIVRILIFYFIMYHCFTLCSIVFM